MYLEAPVSALGEIAFAEPAGRIAKRPFAVHALSRLAQKFRVKVRRQNGDVPFFEIRNESVEQYREGIGFLARATARTPDAQTPLILAARLQQLHENLLPENFQAPLLPEKIGFPDAQVAGEHLVHVACQR